MRFLSTVIAVQVASATALCVTAVAREPVPVVPLELGVQSPALRELTPYECTPFAYNFYHGTNYAEPPATYRGYAYRYYYRYSAYRKVPLSYVCAP